MENEKKKFIADHALLTEENFLLAAQVEKSFEEIMNRLVGKLLKKMEEELTGILGSEWVIENSFDDNAFDRWYVVIYKKKWLYKEKSLYYFGFNPERRRLGEFCFYGSRYMDIIEKNLTVVNQALTDRYKKVRKGSGSCDWYAYFDHEYLTWTNDETLVKLYRQEEMVTYLTEQFIKMKEIIEPIVDQEIEKYTTK